MPRAVAMLVLALISALWAYAAVRTVASLRPAAHPRIEVIDLEPESTTSTTATTTPPAPSTSPTAPPPIPVVPPGEDDDGGDDDGEGDDG